LGEHSPLFLCGVSGTVQSLFGKLLFGVSSGRKAKTPYPAFFFFFSPQQPLLSLRTLPFTFGLGVGCTAIENRPLLHRDLLEFVSSVSPGFALRRNAQPRFLTPYPPQSGGFAFATLFFPVVTRSWGVGERTPRGFRLCVAWNTGILFPGHPVRFVV